MKSKKGKKLHNQAEKARENEDYLNALKITDEAIIAYESDGDQQGLAEVLASRVITLRHLANETNDNSFLILALGQADSSVEIARRSEKKEALAIPLYNLAKAQEDAEKLSEAILTYHNAIEWMENFPPKDYDKDFVLADMRVHLEICRYKAGDKRALENAEKYLQELENMSPKDQYLKDVWISGAYMRLAKILRQDSIDKCKAYFEKAREIIHSNPSLKIRRKQLAEINRFFKHNVHRFSHL